MKANTAPSPLDLVSRAFDKTRAEYEDENDLFGKFSVPLYFNRLLQMTPSFLVGGRGTGKTTTLKSMSFRGQMQLSGSENPTDWQAIGAYWKLAPNEVSTFRGRGVDDGIWSNVFAHYLNLKLSTLVVDYARWFTMNREQLTIDSHRLSLFTKSLDLDPCETVEDLCRTLDNAIVEFEVALNRGVTALSDARLSMLGRPLDYLFDALVGLGLSRTYPFMFCLDEYENLSKYQQRVLNTLIKQVGDAPYTFKIGVRNAVAIGRETLVTGQPLQDPADFQTVDILRALKDESFGHFASAVIKQRLSLIDAGPLDAKSMLKALSIEDEAHLLGASEVKSELVSLLAGDGAVSEEELEFARNLPELEACMVLRWATAHHQTPAEVLRFAIREPKRWSGRMGNYGYALLFTIREKRVGDRKHYAGWKTYLQLADGNIRYLIRLYYEALSLHVTDGEPLSKQISVQNQTLAAKRVGEKTLRDLQSWSRQGVAITRMTAGLGAIFANLARELALATPEVTQIRVRYVGSGEHEEKVDQLLAEAVGQGILVSFDGDKNARRSGATYEIDYQLHPVLSPFFVYSSRSKRRMIIQSGDLLSLTSRQDAPSTVRKILSARGVDPALAPIQDQLPGFSD